MRIAIPATVLFLAIIASVIYATPYLAAQQMRDAALAGDAARLSGYVNFPALRESVKSTVLASVLEDPTRKSGFELLGSALAVGLVNQMVDSFVTPEGLAALMRSGTPPGQAGRPSVESANAQVSMGYESVDRFAVIISPTDPGSKPVTLVLDRDGVIGWKLVALRMSLPQTAPQSAPSAAATPVPAPTAVPVGSRQKPAPLGQMLLMSLSGKKTIGACVIQVERNSSQAIRRFNQFNTQPSLDSEYITVALMVVYVDGPADQPYSVSTTGTEIEAGNRLWGDPSFISLPAGIKLDGQNLFPQGIATGVVAKIIPKEYMDDARFVYQPDWPLGTRYYFDLSGDGGKCTEMAR